MTMTSTNSMMEIDLLALRSKRAGSVRFPFTDVDTFEGQPSEPMRLHKYAYGAGNPVMNIDPSGYDFSVTNLLVTAGISGTVSSLLTAAYGYAKGWSTGQIARAAAYSFFAGAFAGAAIYGLAWGLAASAAVSSGFVAAEAGAYSTLGWTAAGLMTSPTTLGLAIANFATTWKDPNADQVDRAFAGFNLAIAAFVFVGVHAEALSMGGGAPLPLPKTPEFTRAIQEIKAMPANQQLSAEQLMLLRENVRVLKGSVAKNPNNSQNTANVLKLLQEDSRFANLSDAQRQAFVEQIKQTIEPQ